ncbi:MAG TPA: VCBS repeat-containing protein, partial [Bacillota bacterium]|nr:VCBS repeat-containing protein [Bacillota bacterium]
MPLTLPALNFNTARFVDVNNDGHLDMVLGTQLYLSDGSGHFINRPTALPAIGSGGTSWGDFDNDGFLDVAVAGDLNPLRLYRNEGGTNFALVATLGSYGWSTSVMAWGDCDNDGRLDLAFCDGNSSCVIYHNDGNGQFHDIRAKLPDLYAPAFAWGDFDNDGRLDFVLAGQGWVTLVYRNEGEGAFTMVNRSLAGVDHANAWWGDFDNDGQLDLLLCGFNFDLNQINRIYHNNGSGLFTDIQAPFSGYLLAGGDYDNDGYLDVFSYGPPHVLYHNQGTNAFTNSNLAFPASSYSTMAWGDYDNDGRLDILLSGDTGTRLLRNNALTSNAPPAAPTSLQATVRSNAVVLSWGAASDANQAGALTYAVRVGTTPGGCQVVSPMADAATGLRRLPALGNAGECLSSFLLNLPRGVYYWSVQAIDNAFAGSAFAPEQVFPVSPPVLSPIADQVLLANGPALTVTFTVADGETAADALQLTAGSSNTNLVPQANLSLGGSGTNRTLTITQVPPFLGATTIRLTATDAEGQSAVRKFVVQAAGLLPVPNPFTPFYSGAAAWGDYDGDGRLDVVIYGMDEFEHARTRLFHNEGSGRFSLVRAPFLEINGDAAAYGGPGQNVAWGDYDRDGDLDLLVSGGTWYQTSTRLYRNDGLDTDGLPVFTEVEAGLPTDL